jgi:hypothetical protein
MEIAKAYEILSDDESIDSLNLDDDSASDDEIYNSWDYNDEIIQKININLRYIYKLLPENNQTYSLSNINDNLLKIFDIKEMIEDDIKNFHYNLLKNNNEIFILNLLIFQYEYFNNMKKLDENQKLCEYYDKNKNKILIIINVFKIIADLSEDYFHQLYYLTPVLLPDI